MEIKVNLFGKESKENNENKKEKIEMKKENVIGLAKTATRFLVGSGTAMIVNAYTQATGLNTYGKIALSVTRMAISGAVAMKVSEYTDELIDDVAELTEML